MVLTVKYRTNSFQKYRNEGRLIVYIIENENISTSTGVVPRGGCLGPLIRY